MCVYEYNHDETFISRLRLYEAMFDDIAGRCDVRNRALSWHLVCTRLLFHARYIKNFFQKLTLEFINFFFINFQTNYKNTLKSAKMCVGNTCRNSDKAGA